MPSWRPCGARCWTIEDEGRGLFAYINRLRRDPRSGNWPPSAPVGANRPELACYRLRTDPDWPLSAYRRFVRSEQHTSELQSLMRISYAVFCLKKKKSVLYIKQANKKQPTT